MQQKNVAVQIVRATIEDQKFAKRFLLTVVVKFANRRTLLKKLLLNQFRTSVQLLICS